MTGGLFVLIILWMKMNICKADFSAFVSKADELQPPSIRRRTGVDTLPERVYTIPMTNQENDQIRSKYRVYVYDLEYAGTNGKPINFPHHAVESYEVEVTANNEEEAKDLAWDASTEMTGYGLWYAEIDVTKVTS